jgi:hypothetical protein
MLRTGLQARGYNMAFTWDDAACTLCIKNASELSTCHAAMSHK